MKKAFTLAEVLITLGIIGVVAALTMPTLIQKNNEKQIVVKLKKVYSLLQQAQLNIINEYGTFDNLITGNTSEDGARDENGDYILDYTSTEYVKSLFAKHLKVIESCDSGKNCLGKSVYQLNGTKRNDFKDPTLILSDGTKIFFGWMYSNCSHNSLKNIQPTGICGEIGVALPGSAKDRYIFGKDIFYFTVYKNKILPVGLTSVKLSDTECKRSGSGRGCASWVIYNENLDYTRCDDLEWDKKTKCK